MLNRRNTFHKGLFIKKFLLIKEFLGKDLSAIFLKILLMGICLFLVESASIYVIQGFLRSFGLTSSNVDDFLPASYPVGLFQNILILIVFGLVRFISTTILNYYTGIVPEYFKMLQRNRIVSYGLKLDTKESTAQLYSAYTEIAERAGIAIMTIFSGITNLFLGVLILSYGLTMAWREVLIGVVALGVLFIPLRYVNNKVRKSGDYLAKEWALISDSFGNAIRNKFLINLYNLNNQTYEHLEESLFRYNVDVFKYRVGTAIQGNITNFIGLLVFALICFIGKNYFDTDASLLIGIFYLFVRAVQYLTIPLNSYTSFLFTRANIMQLFDIWQKEEKSKLTETVFVKEQEILPRIDITAKNVSFRFTENSKYIFEKLNFQVKSGEFLLIVGPSGAGKSTLLKVILGLLPCEGEVLINGSDHHLTNKSFNDQVAYIGPDPFLIQDSIRKNLTYGNKKSETMTDDQMWKVLESVGLKEEFSKRDGLSTMIQEYEGLSSGQKQRVSIARALLRDPKLLILDECTSNLDEATEEKIINLFKDLSKDLTTIAISHRMSFKRIATSILELN